MVNDIKISRFIAVSQLDKAGYMFIDLYNYINITLYDYKFLSK